MRERDAIEREIAEIHRGCAAGLLRYGADLAGDRPAGQDAVQEAFLRYFTVRSEGQAIRNPRAWLYRVVRNYLLDTLRTAGSRDEVRLDDVADSPDAGPDPETRLGQNQTLEGVWKLFSPRERECVRLRAEGLPYDEIARVLELKPGTVASLLARAHSKLRRKLTPVRRAAVALPQPEETGYAP